MIWEIGQDAFGPDAPYSLLRAIDTMVDAAVGEFPAGLYGLSVYSGSRVIVGKFVKM